jgi:hypothetical protein
VPRKKPIEERRARVPHVDVTRGAGGKPNSNLGHGLISDDYCGDQGRLIS